MRKSATGHADFKNPRARRMRLRALYRDMVLRGEVCIGSAGAVRSMRMLVGPDCAYHLYRGITNGEKR
jgi:hypothetical protein